MDGIREQIKKDVEELWEKELEKLFSSKINKGFKEILSKLKEKLSENEKNISNYLDDFNKKIEEIYTNISEDKLSQLNNTTNNDGLNNNNIKNIKIDNNINNRIDNNNIKIIINNDLNEIEKINNIDNNNKNNINNNINFKVNNNINNIKKEKDEELRQKKIDLNQFNSPPLVKLLLSENINPLINLILQCLSNIKTLILYYFNDKKEEKILKKSKENPNKTFLGPSFLKLLDHLWKSNNKEYSPKEIHKVLYNLMLNKYNSNDPGFIIKFILNQLNKELNFNPVVINDVNECDIFNKDKALQNYLNFFSNNITKISNSFYSTIKTKKRCKLCKQYSYFFESSPVIDIYLESNNNNLLNNVNLIEHLKNLLNDKDNRIIYENCVVCGPKNKYVIKDIYSTTEIIIFNIIRKNNQSYEISFNYPEQFDGKEVINKDIELPYYQLISVIKKIKNNEILEFVEYMKSFINNQWYIYDKSNIELLQNKNDIFDDKNACLLIYCKIN